MSQASRPEEASERPEETRRALDKIQLIRLWERIEDYLRLAAREPEVFEDPSHASGGQGEIESELSVIRRWASLFSEEIEAVRRARNSVAHAYQISDDNLDSALAVARRLVDLAESGLARVSDARRGRLST